VRSPAGDRFFYTYGQHDNRMRTADWLSRSATTVPARVAIVAGGEELTFAALDARVAEAAQRLASIGAAAGVRVGLVLEPSLDYVVLLHALVRVGAVAVPLDRALPAVELERRLERARTSVVIRDPAELADAPPAPPLPERGIDLDSVHCVIHTSGTGSDPKAVELTFGNHLWSALGSGARIGVDREDRWLCSLPLHHIGGLAIVLRSAIYGTAVVLQRFDAEAIRTLIPAQNVTIASLVGTTLARLLDVGAELERLRCVLVGGGPVRQDLLDRALAAGAPISPTYGLTEAASQVTTLAPGEAGRHPGSAGTPILPTEVRIDEGVICVRGATVAPAASGEDGWLRTGDLGRVEEGHLYVLGRADDVIVTGGENVSPEEVERVLLSHPAVADAAVRGQEDPTWQQAVVAVIVTRDGAHADPEEMREFCRARLAPSAVPKRFRFTDRLPRDAQGKLRRRELETD
jgi:O-succinylbenzoic acid--CoA ligase